MTKDYETPYVIHVVETDSDGNKHTVRYIREDCIQTLKHKLTKVIEGLYEGIDRPEFEPWKGEST